MPKVYIPNKSGHNFSSAKLFGDLVYVTEGEINLFGTVRIYQAFVKAMKDISPKDYLLISSANILCSIGAAVMARKTGHLNILMFRQSDNTYVPREISIDSLLEQLEQEGEEDEDGSRTNE